MLNVLSCSVPDTEVLEGTQNPPDLAKTLSGARQPVTGGPAAAPRRPYQVLAGFAIVVQMLLLCWFVVMVLWGGFWYLLNLGQGVALLVLAFAWVRERPQWVLPLPVVSLVLSLVFQAVDPSTIPRKCTPAELSAAAELAPPPGIPSPQFKSTDHPLCTARFTTTTLSTPQLIAHYRRTATRAGWEVSGHQYWDQEGELEPRRLESPPPGYGGLAMTKNELSADVSVVPPHADQPGSGNEVEISISKRR